MQIQLKDGIFWLSGRLDESADLSEFAKATSPLRLNLGGIETINSIGVRKFLTFSLEWSPRKFEFYECTPEFIANVNTIPHLLGNPPDEKQIKTFYVPYRCENCDKVTNVLCDVASVRLQDGAAVLPEVACKLCARTMVLDVEPEEYFMFIDPSAG